MTIYLIILIYSFYRAVRGNIRIFVNFKKLQRLYSRSIKNNTQEIKSDINFTILIPVLREQEIIENTIANIAKIKGKFKVYLITTEREAFEKIKQKELLISLKNKLLSTNKHKVLGLLVGILPKSTSLKALEFIKEKKWNSILDLFDNLLTTKEIIEKEVNKLGLEEKINIIHYPEITGNKTDQLNFAISQIEKNKNPDQEFLLFYDADSEIYPDLINDLLKYITFFPKANVIQQSSLFLLNYHSFLGFWNKSFLQAIALLQSRWTLAHELSRIFKQFETKFGNYIEGSHLVAHGLFIRLSTLQKVGYFPTSFITEDLPLGYLIRLLGEKIYPFPVLENSESPTSIKSMFDMYQSWFLGVIGYFKCSISNFSKKKNRKVRSAIWGITYMIRGGIWLLSSFVWIYLFCYPIFNKSPGWFLISSISFFVYAQLSFFIMSMMYMKYTKYTQLKVQKLKINLLTYISSLPVYLTHSYGPLISSYKFLINALFETEIKRNKTER